MIVDRSELEALTDAVRTRGWQRGFEQFLDALEENRVLEFRSEIGMRHTAWKGLLGSTSRRRALVLDGGLGSVAISLAADYDEVLALFEDPRLMEVVRSRTRYLGVLNIRFVHETDPSRVVAGMGALDAVVLYGFPQRPAPRAFLERCAQALGDTGSLYIGLDHRPRRRGYPRRLARRLRSLFPSVEAYRYEFGLRRVGDFTPWQPSSFSWSALAHAPLSYLRLRIPLGAGLLAHRAPRQPTLFSEAIDAARSPRPARVSRYRTSNPLGAIVFLQDDASVERYVLRIPFDERSLAHYRRNAEMTRTVRDLVPEIADYLPEPLLEGRAADRSFFLETKLEGKEVADTPQVDLFEQAVSALTAIQARTCNRRTLSDEDIESFVIAPFDAAFRNLGEPAVPERVRPILDYTAQTLRGRSLNLVLGHGDYSIDNVLVDASGRLRGILDWDFAGHDRPPFVDLFYFLATLDKQARGVSLARAFADKVFGARVSPAEATVIEAYRSAVGLDRELLLPLAILAWIEHLAVRLKRDETYRMTPLYDEMTREAIEAALDEIDRDRARGLGLHAPARRAPALEPEVRFMLPIQRSSTVLEVAGRESRFGAALAPYCRELIEVDLAPGRRDADAEVPDNLRFLAAEPTALPLPPETCDCVIVNGFPESLGRDHDSARVFLVELKRVLKPDGSIYLGAANRYGLSRRNGAHGYRGYRRLLADCGYVDIRSYTPMPSLEKPAEYLALDSGVPALFEYSNMTQAHALSDKLRNRAVRFSIRLGLFRHLVSAFVVTASKPAAG